MTDLSRYLPVLNSGRWFTQLPAEFAQALLQIAKLRTLQTGDALFLRDSAPCGLYALVSGAIRISGQSGQRNDAREALLVVLTPPQWFGEISVFDGSVRTHHAHAAEPSTVLQVPHEELLAWLQAHPAHWRDLAVLMADKLRMAFVSMEEQTVLSAPLRLARRLVGMAQGYGQRADDGSTRRVLAITQEELALMIGVSRQTTNQILNALKAQHIVRIQRGELEILDLPALRAQCQ
ncbi:Crp/Fnr family transcriptional regulator [Rhodoferax sp. TS-BS-61-7]|uniref:Crp/Fnr family transcriptional regulator n=1 Tax=Rhodoferax sp. TS-BS-61-7 TaxID=2094194 RepID=UPI000CF69901|nr:Crp/Fnr family transcriptional regulator [Rhodoferax sp. TS-BS-61-7]PQA79442.1 Crp/Fnr family transcriptional regulator [Rhodoferax sp. TS-BS-61-7]